MKVSRTQIEDAEEYIGDHSNPANLEERNDITVDIF